MTRSHISFILSFIATILTFSLIIGCGGSGGSGSQVGAPAAEDTAGQTAALESDAADNDTDNAETAPSVPFVCRDTVVGQFVRGVADTLVLESDEMPGGSGAEWVPYTIYSLQGSVDTLFFGFLYGLRFMNAGDLDGNGTDELWILPHSMSRHSYRYDFLTYRKGAWHTMLAERIPIGYDWLDTNDERDLFRKSKRRGYLHAKVMREIYVDSLGNRLPEPIDFDSGQYIDWWGYEVVDTLLRLLPDGPEFVHHLPTVVSYY